MAGGKLFKSRREFFEGRKYGIDFQKSESQTDMIRMMKFGLRNSAAFESVYYFLICHSMDPCLSGYKANYLSSRARP